MKSFPFKFRLNGKGISLLAAALIAFGLLRVVVIWQVTFERIEYEKEQALQSEFMQGAHLAAAVKSHTERTLKSLEKTFDQAERFYRTAAGTKTDLSRVCAESGINSKNFPYLALIDASGRVVVASDNSALPDPAGQDYFKRHQANKNPGLYMARLVAGAPGKEFVYLSRRLDQPDGSFGGVIVGMVESSYFTAPYPMAGMGIPRTVTLVGLDRFVRAAGVQESSILVDDVTEGTLVAAQQKQAEGSFVDAGHPDGAERIYSYRTLADYPLFVAVGSSMADTLSSTLPHQKKYFTRAALATLAVLLAVSLTLWLLMRHQRLWLDVRKSRALQRATFNMAAIGVAHVDLDGRYRRVSDSLCSLLGYQSDELCDMPVYGQLFPADHEACESLLQNLRSEHLQKPSHTLELRYLHKNGSMIWALASVSAVRGIADSEKYFIFALQDITHQKQASLALQESNRQLASAFEDSAIGMALTLPDGKWLKLNRALCNMLGYSETELMSKSLQEVTHTEDLAVSRQQMQQALRDGAHPYRMETRYRHRDGQPIWVSQLVSLVRDADGQPKHVIVQVQDINQQKLAEDEVAQLQAGLEERVRQRTQELQFATREITDFSYSMAHDLRQPLSSIMGFSELLKREVTGQLSERGVHCLERIGAGVHQIHDLTEAMGTLAQLSSAALRHEPTDLSQIARSAVERCQQPEPDRPATIQIQDNMLALGDARLLKVVMDNLIANAWKFSSPMASTHIEVGSDTNEDGETVYFVSDKGVGFDMAFTEKLFENFQRLHSPAEFLGHGIGLASARRVIARHGGRIWAHSRPGEGAVFYFTLSKAPG